MTIYKSTFVVGYVVIYLFFYHHFPSSFCFILHSQQIELQIDKNYITRKSIETQTMKKMTEENKFE